MFAGSRLYHQPDVDYVSGLDKNADNLCEMRCLLSAAQHAR